MRILVCSDSHGRRDQLLRALDQQPAADICVFLGDGVDDAAFFLHAGKEAYLVRGNCDGGSGLPPRLEFACMGRKVLCTHGHYERVKYGIDGLLRAARGRNADLALYGHTHAPRLDYLDGVYLFNPGSIADGRYGFADITPAGIVCVNRQVR
jgi:putative phosphoesterase